MTDEATNKANAIRFLEAISSGDADTALALVAETYIPRSAPHNDVPQLAPGRDALRTRLAVPRPLTIHRVAADGDLVFAQVRYDGPAPIAGMDIFRFDAAGLIAEHINVRQDIAKDAARGVDRYAGAGDTALPASRERREEMKQVMRTLNQQVWREGDPDAVDRHYDPAYIQHNPDMGQGSAGIRHAVETEVRHFMEKNGSGYPVTEHLFAAEGDLIFLYYSVFMAGIGRSFGHKSTNSDIFRIDADNRMVEHWDVLQVEGEGPADGGTYF